MVELVKSPTKIDKRVFFTSGEQAKFLLLAIYKLKLSWPELADSLGVHSRTLNDWKRERYSLPLKVAWFISQKAQVPMPVDVEIKDPFWYVATGARAGGLVVYRKYGRVGGDQEYRKKKWREWWDKKGRYKVHSLIGSITPSKKPRHSKDLAEFVGILLGDGGITPSQIKISLHKFDDRAFSFHVKHLIQKLFAINPAVYERKEENTIIIAISRTELVKYFNAMGLPIGNKVKHQVDVPIWIKRSRAFTRCCLRGLFDTDGCFYIDKHRYKDKIYNNPAMNFTNRSFPLLSFFKENIEKLDMHPTRTTKFSVALRRENEIQDYFQKVGSSNPKHLNKFQQYFK